MDNSIFTNLNFSYKRMMLLELKYLFSTKPYDYHYDKNYCCIN